MTSVTALKPKQSGISTEELMGYFSHVFANSRDMMNLFSVTQKKIILWNESAGQVMGYTTKDFESTSIEQLYPPEDQMKLFEALQILVQQGYSTGRLKMYSKDGELRDLWLRSYIVQWEPDIIALVHTIDFTEEERKIQKSIQGAKLASLGEYSAVLAHELGNAVNALRAHLVLLERDAGNTFTTNSRSRLERAKHSLSYMEHVFRNIQQFARSAESRPKYSSVNLVAGDAVQILEGVFESNDITTSCEIATNLQPIWVDAGQLQQILVILMKNAAQAMAGRPLRKLTVTANEQEGRIETRVTDTGPGLAPEVQSRVFQAFVSTKAAGHGMGLGLSIAKRLADANDIQIRFETGAEGTTFILSLPTQPKSSETTPPTAAGPVHTILIVDESPDFLYLVGDLLTARGFRTLTTSSTSEALQLLELHSIEAAFFSAKLYPLSGLRLALEARRVYKGPICLMSPKESFEDPTAMKDADIGYVLQKPFPADSLVQVLEKMKETEKG